MNPAEGSMLCCIARLSHKLPDLVLAERAASLLARSPASAAFVSISTNLEDKTSQNTGLKLNPV